MSNRFVISDTHFGHTNSWEKFKLPNGDPLRPFTSTEEMDEAMVERWNAVVRPQDTVYHLGDVVINKKSLHHVKRLNGKKRLIRGNHDIFKDQDYRDVGFDSLYGVRVFVDQFILSHIPLHPDSVTNRFRVNLHGHLHANKVMRPYYTTRSRYNEFGHYSGDYAHLVGMEEDPRYLCVCVEHTNFTPISFDEVEARIKKQWEEVGYQPPTGSGWGNGQGPG
jgi:calcineurin-like phosphoesterase family protein